MNLAVDISLDAMAGSQVRGGRCKIRVLLVSAVGIQRCGVCDTCADEERYNG